MNLGHYLSNFEIEKGLCNFIPSCIGRSSGFYLDRTKPNCQSYIQCLDDRVAARSRCPHGQRFNGNLGHCTRADQVPCLGRYFCINEYKKIKISLSLYFLRLV